MKEVQINCVLKDELQKTVGDNMKRDGKFYGNCRDMRGQHATFMGKVDTQLNHNIQMIQLLQLALRLLLYRV